jgi:nucleoside-diphosphate-sugar epimerase
MRALITGATGFLGSHLARQLVERGDQVVALVRTTSDRSRLDGLAVDEAIGDVTDAASVQRALDGVDQVFHCAGVVEFGPRDRAFLDQVNVDGTRNVLGAAVAEGIPAVHVSSLAALGATVLGEEPKDETWWSPERPAAVYEETKRRGHEHARALAADGASVRIVMPGGIYGVGDQSTLHDLIRAYSLWPLPLGYFPEIRQSTVHVDDCADALLRVADRGVDGGEYVAVAESVTIREWLTLIAQGGGHRPPRWYVPTRVVRRLGGPAGRASAWFGRSPTEVPETIAVATHDCAYTGDKLRTELGWEPRPLAEGMAEMARGLQAERAEAKAAKQVARRAARSARAG